MVTGSTRRAVLPAATAAGLVALVWATVTGPARMFGPVPDRPRPLTQPLRRPTPTAGTPGQTLQHLRHAVHGQHHLAWIGTLLGWTVLLLAAVAVGTALVWLWRNRWRPPTPPLDVDVEVLPSVELTEALERTAAQRLAAVQQGSARNGIVACWLLVEEAIAEAGLPRLPWETSTEYTVRVLHSLDIDPRPIGALAGLYREARFSEHPMTEADRGSAEDAVQRLDQELRSLNARVGGATA